VEPTDKVKTRVERPPFRKLLIQLIVVAAQTMALVVIDKTMGDGIAFVVGFLGYGGYIAWYFWSHRYQ
jgi:hypothetical protein